ncbi:hypothetical protein KAI52_03530 [Candidatus Parcubacteria bacterium]|nr:hypothetical protein [Candidatus Parcubacteria bacterium]
MTVKTKNFIAILIIFAFVFVMAQSTCASEPAKVTVIVRDSYGRLLKNTKFEIFHQTSDANGKRILGKRAISGNTGEAGEKLFNMDVQPFIDQGQRNRFVFKIYSPDSKKTPFYFWNIIISNNRSHTKVFRLSSVKIFFRSVNGDILKDKKFTVYSRNIELNECACDKEKILSLSTGSEGCEIVHLPEGRYTVEIPTIQKLSISRDFYIISKERTTFDYTISNLTVVLRGSDDSLLVKKKFEIYNQSSDIDHNIILGERIGSYDTGVNGSKNIILSPGVYVIKFFGDAKQAYYMYNQEIIESESKFIEYRLSSLKISFVNKSENGKFNKIRTTVYEQELDTNNQKILGKKIYSFVINSGDYKNLYLPNRQYALLTGRDKFFDINVYENRLSELSVIKLPDDYAYKFSDPVQIEKAKSAKKFQQFYGKERLSDLKEERRRAIILKQELERILGKNRIGVAAQDWHILVNAFIYGGYSASEIAHTIKNGPLVVHPEISAVSWRKSNDYKKYLQGVR